ncbi:MAG: L-2-hydroxyglutarate oxidase [Sulfurospirillum sp.]|nr:MAG: L-2-hydroxyglutarate oxidase [Sulfurospirillum sp.]
MYDYLIIGAGVIGLAVAKSIKEHFPDASVCIIEKESGVGFHSSGRNSGVLHAGFYYTASSLKARFTRDGNRLLTRYCEEHNLKINRCKKVVIAQNDEEVRTLHELYRRGIQNGVEVMLWDAKTLYEHYPNIKTHKEALYSPHTATVDPKEILTHLQKTLTDKGVEIRFNTPYTPAVKNQAKKIINCAGLYADKIAKDFGFSKNYKILPFKGIYLKYTKNDRFLDTNVYPVPNLKNPFLGVHYTITVDHEIKIGPTAIPAFWRENYAGMKNFRFSEFADILTTEAKLMLTNSFGFRNLAFEEMKKYRKRYFISLASKMLHKVDESGFTQWSRPGIRAQLLDTRTNELLQDFVVEGDRKSVHILNAVSPAFTSSFPFAEWVVENYL